MATSSRSFRRRSITPRRRSLKWKLQRDNILEEQEVIMIIAISKELQHIFTEQFMEELQQFMEEFTQEFMEEFTQEFVEEFTQEFMEDIKEVKHLRISRCRLWPLRPTSVDSILWHQP
jgi:predicted molibdopterin-dependent oxidoreductase YjgC